MLALGALHPPALPIGFVQKHCRRAADVERIHRGRHGNRHFFVACFQHNGRDTVPFAAENDATFVSEICLRDGFATCVRMRRNATNAARPQFAQRLRKAQRSNG